MGHHALAGADRGAGLLRLGPPPGRRLTRPTGPLAVRLRGFGWRHAGRRGWAVRGVDLDVAAGERVLLLGPSGAGKSTLLAALAGLLDPEGGDAEGEVLLDGAPVEAGRHRVGVLPQDPQASLVMTLAGDDVSFGCENVGWPREDLARRVSEVLDLVGWRYGTDRQTAALSGGEAQRLALAGAVAPAPGLLLLDEPTADLDPAGAQLVRSSVRAVLEASRATCVVVEHRVADTLDLVDRVVVLEPGGGVVADGPAADVLREQGARLAAAGVWVPGHEPRPSRRARTSRGPALLHARQVDHPRLGPAAREAARELDVHAGEALALTGGNGAGKTTLALLLGGLLVPAAGAVTATAALREAADLPADGPVRRWPRRSPAAGPLHRWAAAPLARAVGSVLQRPEHTFLHGRVREELALGPRRQGADEDAARAVADRLLARLRLEHLAEAHPFTLSGGEARRLSVATALATAPAVLLLDEPTSGQDALTWAELVDLLADLRDEGRGVVAVTHDRALVDALADREHDLTPREPVAA